MSNSQKTKGTVKQEEAGSSNNIDIAEADTTAVYQIRPKLEEKFKPLYAKEIINNVLSDHLLTKKFDKDEAQTWSKEIADSIRDKIKKLAFKKYKYVINVILGQRNGAGIKVGTRCIWDAEADSYAYDSFTNETIFCVAAVYAVYHY